jgi:iron complex transport system ATP-binding protein
MSSQAIALQVQQLDVAIGKRDVIRNVSVEATLGELIAVIGANGSGKTTLMKAIAGLLPPQRGDIKCFGRSVQNVMRRQFAQQVSYMPQQTDIVFGFTVEEVVLLGRFAHVRGAGFASDADLQVAVQAMTQCEVEHLAARRFDQLSGGEARRVLLAQALCQQAKCLLLDEPTAALDVAHAHHLMQILHNHCKGGVLAVLVTHDLDLAIRYASRIWLMSNGEMVADGLPREVLSSAQAKSALGIALHIGQLPSGQSFAVPA